MTVEGIDISHWQYRTPPLGTSLEFVFVRATYGIYPDDRYDLHAKDVRSAGKILGAYHFGRNGDPVPQVRAFLDAIGPTVKLVALDLEKDGGLPRMTNAQASAWIAAVQKTGRKVGLYHSESGFPHLGQDFNWVANWDQTPSIPWTFHQYAVIRSVDRDRFKGSIAELEALAGIPSHWRWQGKAPAYQLYTAVDPAAKTWSRRHRVLTLGTKTYRCSVPTVFHYLGPRNHTAERLVHLGPLVETGQPGPLSGKWVSADTAKRVFP